MGRAAVADVQVLDPLSPTWNPNEQAFQTGEETIMLAFLNVAGDPSILETSAKSRERLLSVVMHIAGRLHTRGTLAIPMESNWRVDFGHIDGERHVPKYGVRKRLTPHLVLLNASYLSLLNGRTN